MNRRNFVIGALGAVGAAIAAPVAVANYVKPLKPKGVLGYSDKRIPTWDEIRRFAAGFEFDESVALTDAIYYHGKETGKDSLVYLSFVRHDDDTGRSLLIGNISKQIKVNEQGTVVYKCARSRTYFIDSVGWEEKFGEMVRGLLEA